jgi:hypothetical protein
VCGPTCPARRAARLTRLCSTVACGSIILREQKITGRRRPLSGRAAAEHDPGRDSDPGRDPQSCIAGHRRTLPQVAGRAAACARCGTNRTAPRSGPERPTGAALSVRPGPLSGESPPDTVARTQQRGGAAAAGSQPRGGTAASACSSACCDGGVRLLFSNGRLGRAVPAWIGQPARAARQTRPAAWRFRRVAGGWE